jgi:hypothetical protein
LSLAPVGLILDHFRWKDSWNEKRLAEQRVDRTAAEPRRFAVCQEAWTPRRDGLAWLTAAVGHSWCLTSQHVKFFASIAVLLVTVALMGCSDLGFDKPRYDTMQHVLQGSTSNMLGMTFVEASQLLSLEGSIGIVIRIRSQCTGRTPA